MMFMFLQNYNRRHLLSYTSSSENCNGRLIVKVRHVISNMGYKDKGVSEKVILKDIIV